MFRDCFIDPYQGKVAAAYYAYNKLGKQARPPSSRTIDDRLLPRASSQFFKESFEALGGKVVAEVSYAFRAQDVDFRAPALTKIKAANPDIIFIPELLQGSGPGSAKQARDLGIKQLLMMGGDGWPSENLIQPWPARLARRLLLFVNHLDFDDPAVKPTSRTRTRPSTGTSTPS